MPKNQELPGVTGPGVEKLVIPELDKLINKYEKKKDARCAESPAELAAKKELRVMLQSVKDKLPTNGDGARFYRHDDKDYILEEKLSVRSVEVEEAE
jgi:hypothetical protein